LLYWHILTAESLTALPIDSELQSRKDKSFLSLSVVKSLDIYQSFSPTASATASDIQSDSSSPSQVC